MRASWLLAPMLLATLCGCGAVGGGPAPAATSGPAPNEVTVTPEQNGKFLAFVGPRRPHAEPFLGVPNTNIYTLRSWLDTRNGEAAHQLYVEDSYFGAERNWEAARDGKGQNLRFIPISKNEITCNPSCSYAEEFAAVLPGALLRGSPGGLAVTFSAKSGERKTLDVPGELVAKQLAAIDTAHASLPSAAAPAAPPSPRP